MPSHSQQRRTAGGGHAPAAHRGGAAPGKQTPTSRLPAGPATGYPLIDDGPLCERDGAEALPGCHLTETERTRLILLYQTRLITAMDNFAFALQSVELDLATASGPGWGALEEFLFAAGSGYLVSVGVRGAIAVLGRVAARLAETPLDAVTLRIAKIDDKGVRTVLGLGSRALRSELKHGRTGLPEGNDGKKEFVRGVQRGIKPFIDVAVANAGAFDDDTLAAVTHGYGDLAVHDTAVYVAEISTWLSGIDRNRIDDVGRTRVVGKRIGQDFGDEEITRGRLAWITRPAGRRLALFEGHGGGHTFGRWIDPDYEVLALEMYQVRTGLAPTVDDADDVAEANVAAPDATWLDAFLGEP